MVIYDVYEQEIQKQENIGNRTVTRYHTENKKKAFKFIDDKNKLAGKNIWRVAVQVNNRIYFDIDNEVLKNVTAIKKYYDMLFGDLEVIKTYHGYHLRSEIYKDSIQWEYDICRVLNPLLEPENLQKYIEAIQYFYRTERNKQIANGLQRDDFIPYFSNAFKESGLYFGIGDFDILFAVNVIMKGYYCIRISKKGKDDNPHIIVLP